MRGEGATRFVRLASGNRAGVPVTILPCRAMTVLRWLLLHFCDVVPAVTCAGVLRELLAGFPVAVGGMKGARIRANALRYFLYFIGGNPCACRGVAWVLSVGLRREGCCLALFLAQPPKRGGILACGRLARALARWRMKARMGLCPVGVLWPPGAACAPGVRVIGGLG